MDASLLVELNNVEGFVTSFLRTLYPAQKAWRYIPTLPSVCNDRHGLLVVTGHNANHRWAVIRLETDTIADLKL